MFSMARSKFWDYSVEGRGNLEGDEVAPNTRAISRLDFVIKVIKDYIIDVLVPSEQKSETIITHQARISVISPILPSRTFTLNTSC